MSDLYKKVMAVLAKAMGDQKAAECLERNLTRCGVKADGFAAPHLATISKFLVAAVELATDKAKAEAVQNQLSAL